MTSKDLVTMGTLVRVLDKNGQEVLRGVVAGVISDFAPLRTQYLVGNKWVAASDIEVIPPPTPKRPSLLVTGLVPAGAVCPFTDKCGVRSDGNCKHKGAQHEVAFSCALARAYDLLAAIA